MSEEENQRLLVLKHTSEFHDRIHNHIVNAAFYYRKLIDKRIAANDKDGIGFDYMSCLLLTAFGFEAVVNFYGQTLFKDNWDAWLSPDEKLRWLVEYLKLDADFGRRPYQSVAVLREFRNMIVHGQPQVVKLEKIVTVPENDSERPWTKTKWETYLEPAVIARIYEDVERVQKEIADKSGVPLFETLSGGFGSTSFIKEIFAPKGRRKR